MIITIAFENTIISSYFEVYEHILVVEMKVNFGLRQKKGKIEHVMFDCREHWKEKKWWADMMLSVTDMCFSFCLKKE